MKYFLMFCLCFCCSAAFALPAKDDGNHWSRTDEYAEGYTQVVNSKRYVYFYIASFQPLTEQQMSDYRSYVRDILDVYHPDQDPIWDVSPLEFDLIIRVTFE